MTKKYVFLLSRTFLLAPVITVSAQDLQNDREAKLQRRMAVMEALGKPDGLHQAAKANGGTFHISQTSYDFVRLTTLESLAENSDMAIIGMPISSENRLISDGRSIVTEYKVKVEEPIQGKAQWDDVLTLDLPGGKIAFEDGTTADVDVGDFPRLEIGHRYVIYLELIKELNIRQPLGGPEGVFELRADGKVTPFAAPEYTQAAAKDDDVLEFLERVRNAARGLIKFASGVSGKPHQR